MRAHTAVEIVALAKKHKVKLVCFDESYGESSIYGWEDEQGNACGCAAGVIATAEDASGRALQLREARDGDWFLLGLECGFEDWAETPVHAQSKDEPNYENGYKVGVELRAMVKKEAR